MTNSIKVLCPECTGTQVVTKKYQFAKGWGNEWYSDENCENCIDPDTDKSTGHIFISEEEFKKGEYIKDEQTTKS